MPVNYEALYFRLFNRVTDALAQLDSGRPAEARETLIEAQREAEEAYIEADGGEFAVSH